jgi:hypothetical protein
MEYHGFILLYTYKSVDTLHEQTNKPPFLCALSSDDKAVWKVTSGKLLTRQAIRKEIYYVQKIEALVISRNEVLYACPKDVSGLEN